MYIKYQLLKDFYWSTVSVEHSLLQKWNFNMTYNILYYIGNIL